MSRILDTTKSRTPNSDSTCRLGPSTFDLRYIATYPCPDQWIPLNREIDTRNFTGYELSPRQPPNAETRWPKSRLLSLMQLLPIQWLPGFLLRSDGSDLFSSCTPPPEANLRATLPDPTADGISLMRSDDCRSSSLTHFY